MVRGFPGQVDAVVESHEGQVADFDRLEDPREFVIRLPLFLGVLFDEERREVVDDRRRRQRRRLLPTLEGRPPQQERQVDVLGAAEWSLSSLVLQISLETGIKLFDVQLTWAEVVAPRLSTYLVFERMRVQILPVLNYLSSVLDRSLKKVQHCRFSN